MSDQNNSSGRPPTSTAEVVLAPKQPSSELEYRLRQQALLAELGRRALAMTSIDDLLQEATKLVALGLETAFCKILEYQPETGLLLVKAGVGWQDNVIGVATVGADLKSPAGYALHTGKPVISNDLGTETRFRTPTLLRRHGIQRAINVILSAGAKPFGVLEVDSQIGGTFTEHDIDFLQGAANLLGVAIEHHEKSAALRQLNETLEQRVTMEVAERRQTEQALQTAQKMEAVGQLTGGVAHDFNNLLTIIRGNLQLIAASVKDDERLTRLIDAAETAVGRGEKLTSQLLAFARRLALRPETRSVNSLVQEFDILAGRIVGETVELEIDLDPGAWPCELDASQFSSALLNLVVNAGDAMPDGGKLAIRTQNVEFDDKSAAQLPEANAGSYVMISVEDSGQGMTSDVAGRAIEPFFTTKDVGKGTGLGLSQVYGFVRQSNGFLTIDTAPGAGTTVRVYLPRAEDSSVATDSPRDAAAEGGSETILIVEDDAGVRQVVLEALSTFGYRTLEARNGAEALDVLTSDEAVDLLLTDAVMPGGMSGLELAAEARRIWPKLKVLLTSGYAGTEKFPQNTGQDLLLLHKPYSLTDLDRFVREALNQ